MRVLVSCYFRGKCGQLIINDLTRSHMTDDAKFVAGPKVKIDYSSATDKRMMTVYWNGRELVGEF